MPKCRECGRVLGEPDRQIGECVNCNAAYPGEADAEALAVREAGRRNEAGAAAQHTLEPPAPGRDSAADDSFGAGGWDSQSPPAQSDKSKTTVFDVADTVKPPPPPQPSIEHDTDTTRSIDPRRLSLHDRQVLGQRRVLSFAAGQIAEPGVQSGESSGQTGDSEGKQPQSDGQPAQSAATTADSDRQAGESDRQSAETVFPAGPAEKAGGVSGNGGVDAGRAVAEAERSIPYRNLCLGSRPESAPADYELLYMLGEGAIGEVHAARQASVAREVAVKRIKADPERTEENRAMIVSEAIVTGDLDHPNIVPIYDMGRDDSGSLFYSMKKVVGQRWMDVIGNKSRAENLEILMKVADAVAFAHSRGVIHRDLKPENVMLGEFGEVLVMDWGLAQVTRTFREFNRIQVLPVPCGTPAYMPPELWNGPLHEVGPAADVYLLGAMLFEIVTGHPPHEGATALICGFNAGRNQIRQTTQRDELLDIALKAMETEPQDRYPSVQELQREIRRYQSHSESLRLSEDASKSLQRAEPDGPNPEELRSRHETDSKQATESAGYADYQRAVFGFEKALELWPQNAAAREGLHKAKYAYAARARSNGDFDLGISLLEQDATTDAEYNRLLQKIRRDKYRHARKNTIIAGLVLLMVCGAIYGGARIVLERNEAVEQRQRAESLVKQRDEQIKEVEKQKIRAEANEEKAKKHEAEAIDNLAAARKSEKKAKANEQRAIEKEEAAKLAEQAAKSAEQAAMEAAAAARDAELKELAERKRAEENARKVRYAAYLAQIGLAAAKIEDDAFDDAVRLLDDYNPHDEEHRDLIGWEWHRLKYLAGRAAPFLAGSPIEAVAFAPDGRRFVTAGADGFARVWTRDPEQTPLEFHHGAPLLAVAFAPGGRIATGGDDGRIRLWDAGGEPGPAGELTGHTAAVAGLDFSPDGRWLVSASHDSSVRIWDARTGDELYALTRTQRGHRGEVYGAAFSPDLKWIVSVGRDSQAVAWPLQQDAGGRLDVNLSAVKPFWGHPDWHKPGVALYAVAFSPDGAKVATADGDGRVLVWDPAAAPPFRGVGNGPPMEFLELKGLGGAVRSLCFSADGRGTYIAGCGEENAIAVWRSNDGWESNDGFELSGTLRGHSGWVRSCRFSPDFDELLLLSGSRDAQARLWELAGQEEIRVLGSPISREQDGRNNSFVAAFSPDGRRAATAGRHQAARIWNVGSGAVSAVLQEGHRVQSTKGAAAVYLPGDEDRILTVEPDETARVWDLRRGVQLAALTDTGRTPAAAVSRDGRWILTGRSPAKGGGAQLWDANRVVSESSPMPVLELADNRAGDVSAVAISPDARLLMTGNEAGGCYLWDRETGRLVRTIRNNNQRHTGRITAALFSPDGRRLITASADRTVIQWDVADGAVDTTRDLWNLGPRIGRRPVVAATLSPDGSRLLTASIDSGNNAGGSRISVWDLSNPDRQPEELHAIDLQPGERVTSVAFAPNGREAVSTSQQGRENIVRQWDLQAGRELRSFKRHEAAAAVYSSDGARLLTGGGGGAAEWNAPTNRLITQVFPTRTVVSASFTCDGKYVATADEDGVVQIWNAATGRAEYRALKLQDKPVRRAVFTSKTGSYRFLAAGDDPAPQLWNWDPQTQRAELLRTLSGHTGGIRDAAFSPDGRLIATAADDQTVRVWNAEGDGGPVVFDAHQAPVQCIAFGADDAHLWIVSADAANTIRIWNPRTGDERLAHPMRGHTADIASLAFSQDGRRVLTGSHDRTAKLWDARTGKEILTLRGHHELGLTTVAFSPDGKHVLTGSLDNTAILWLTEQQSPAEQAGD